jgi:hypothetical protein
MPVQMIPRTVRFFKVRVVQADDTVVSGRDREVFPLVHARCGGTAPDRREMWRNGRVYTGWAATAPVAQGDYLVVGKKRNPVDNPGVATGDGLPEPLELKGVLVEQTYVVAVPDSPCIATLGTSNCPRSGAIADWMTRISGLGDERLSVRLVPVLRTDAQEKLRRARGALSFTVKIPVSAADSVLGHIGNAFRAASGFADGEGELQFEFTLGRHRKGRKSEQTLLDEVAQVADLSAASKALARLRIDDEDSTVTELVDFIESKLTARVFIQCNSEVPLSNETAVRALAQAIWDNREHLRECA